MFCPGGKGEFSLSFANMKYTGWPKKQATTESSKNRNKELPMSLDLFRQVSVIRELKC